MNVLRLLITKSMRFDVPALLGVYSSISTSGKYGFNTVKRISCTSYSSCTSKVVLPLVVVAPGVVVVALEVVMKFEARLLVVEYLLEPFEVVLD